MLPSVQNCVLVYPQAVNAEEGSISKDDHDEIHYENKCGSEQMGNNTQMVMEIQVGTNNDVQLAPEERYQLTAEVDSDGSELVADTEKIDNNTPIVLNIEVGTNKDVQAQEQCNEIFPEVDSDGSELVADTEKIDKNTPDGYGHRCGNK